MGFKARQMRPGLDTVSTMAMHYCIQPNQACDIIRKAGAEVTREDGFRGQLTLVPPPTSSGKIKCAGWKDGTPIDPSTTRLTRAAIDAVAAWGFQELVKSQSDN